MQSIRRTLAALPTLVQLCRHTVKQGWGFYPPRNIVEGFGNPVKQGPNKNHINVITMGSSFRGWGYQNLAITHYTAVRNVASDCDPQSPQPKPATLKPENLKPEPSVLHTEPSAKLPARGDNAGSRDSASLTHPPARPQRMRIKIGHDS